MFNPDLSQIFKPDDGRYGEMENVDALLNYENNEFMVSLRIFHKKHAKKPAFTPNIMKRR
jgi:hypothetical protein